MGKISIEPYELSIWKEKKEIDKSKGTRIVTDTKEIFMFLIGSETMATPAAAFDIYFDEDVNGSHSLTFSLNSKYIDYDSKKLTYSDEELTSTVSMDIDINSGLIDNPYIPFLCNESKIKLNYKNKWYDFIIKDIQENSETGVFTYQASDQFINELSRNGYNVELNTELQNNMGTVQELAREALRGTDWEVEDGNIKQYVEEPLYQAKLSSTSIDCKNLETGEVFSAYATGTIYMFYSCIITKNPFMQFIYFGPNQKIQTDDNGIILNGIQCSPIKGDEYRNIEYNNDHTPINLISSSSGMKLEPHLRGKRLVRSLDVFYDPAVERTVTRYRRTNPTTGASEDCYYYYGTEFQKDENENILKGNENFSSSSLKNWVSEDNVINTQEKNLIIFPTEEEAEIYNNSLYQSMETTKLKKDEVWITAITVPNENALELAGNGWEAYWNNSSLWSGINTPFSLGRNKASNDETDEVSCPLMYFAKCRGGVFNTTYFSRAGGAFLESLGVYYWYNLFGTSSSQSQAELQNYANNNVINPGDATYFFVGKALEDWDSLKSSISFLPRLQIKIPESNSVNNTPLKIRKIECFPARTKWYANSSGKYVSQLSLPTKLDEDNLTTEQSMVFHIMYIHNSLGEPTIIEKSPEPPNKNLYEPVYNENFSKVSSIEVKESNYFNITQDLCEKFECWAKYDVLHNNDGTIVKSTRYAYVDDNGNIRYFNKENTDDPVPSGSVQVQWQNKKISFLDPIPPSKADFGFKYGVNLNSIQRTVNSEQITSRTIVQDNANEFANNGFCSIARATENYSKENSILNLDYFVQMGLINEEELNNDLYILNPYTAGELDISTEPSNSPWREYIGYYYAIRKYNLKIDELNEKIIKKSLEIDNYKAELELLILEEEAKKKEQEEAKQELKVKTGYNYTDLSSPPETAQNTIANLLTQQWISTIMNVVSKVAGKIANLTSTKNAVEAKYLLAKTEYEAAKKQIEEYTAKKREIINKFYNKYSRFIQEGTWISEDYIDDSKYYLDALKVANTSAYPQISYSIQIVDISGTQEYSGLKYEVGQITYIEDPTFFGSTNGIPNREEVFVSHIKNAIDAPEKTEITVQNYRSDFQDLFQRVTAAVQTLEFKGGTYKKFSNIITPDGEIRVDALQTTINNNKLILQNAGVQSVEWGEKGITVTSVDNPNKILRIINEGVYLSTDGGDTYFNAIRGDGISASIINTGSLNTQLITIANGSTPSFHWDAFGLSAFAFKENPSFEDGYEYDLTQYVRFDQYGIYGIKGHTADWTPPLGLTSIFNEAYFSLTWEGFGLKTGEDRGIRITSDEDLVLYNNLKNNNGEFVYQEDGRIAYQELVKIGTFKESNESHEYNYYGMKIQGDGIIQLKERLYEESNGLFKYTNLFTIITDPKGLFLESEGDIPVNYAGTLNLHQVYEGISHPTFVLYPNGIVLSNYLFTGDMYGLSRSVGQPYGAKYGYTHSYLGSGFSFGVEKETELFEGENHIFKLEVGDTNSATTLALISDGGKGYQEELSANRGLIQGNFANLTYFSRDLISTFMTFGIQEARNGIMEIQKDFGFIFYKNNFNQYANLKCGRGLFQSGILVFGEDNLISVSDEKIEFQSSDGEMITTDGYIGRDSEINSLKAKSVVADQVQSVNTFIINNHSHFENYKEKGEIRTGCFWYED